MEEFLENLPEVVTANWQGDAVEKQRDANLRDVRVLRVAQFPQAELVIHIRIFITLIELYSLSDQEILLAPDEESTMVSSCLCKRITVKNQSVQALHDLV
jgi:hypothetical protein